MKKKDFKDYEWLLSWTYSLSFPLSTAALIYTEVRFQGNWPAGFGLLFLCMGLVLLVCDMLFPSFRGYSKHLRRQAIYFDVWVSLIGSWLYWQFQGLGGLILVLCNALPLWLLCHRELLLLKAKS